jgi:hypothetical protein
VEYLEKVKVYSSDIRAPRYKVRFSKALRALPEAIFTAHWDYCNKILRWILPSRKTNLISIALIATALLCYDWSLSLKWWSLLYILMFIICLAIPGEPEWRIDVFFLLRDMERRFLEKLLLPKLPDKQSSD